MSLPIFTIGTGHRLQYAMREDGFWFIRSKEHGLWSAWRHLGTRARPDNIWYNPGAGRAKLPKE